MNYGLPVSSNYYSVLHPEVVNSTHTAQLSEKNTGVVQAVFQPENSRTWLEMIFNNLLSAGEMYDWLIFTYDSNRATFYNTQNAKYSTAAQNPKQALFAFFSFFSFFYNIFYTLSFPGVFPRWNYSNHFRPGKRKTNFATSF